MPIALNPIDINQPPKHTQMQIKCNLCEKKDVCCFQKDYRKTVTLIQQILGDPQEDRLLTCECGFVGKPFEDNDLEKLPEEIKIKGKDDLELTGTKLSARFINPNKIKLLYEIEKYFVCFDFKWSTEFERFENSNGKEIFYGIIYEMTTESIEEILPLLEVWRTAEIEREEKNKQLDIINTTLFSAILNCSAYSPIKRSLESSKNCAGVQHIATYHAESKTIPLAYNQVVPQPVYPVFLPKPPVSYPKRPPKRRDDV